jgi:D-alanyl-D-alanine dipeptidase
VPAARRTKVNPALAEITALAQSYSTASIRRLAAIIGDPFAPVSAVISAIAIMLDRAYGKAVTTNNTHVSGTLTLEALVRATLPQAKAKGLVDREHAVELKAEPAPSVNEASTP